MMFTRPPKSFISVSEWKKIPHAEKPRGYVPIIIGRLTIDQVVIGYVHVKDVPG
jgi:hypothetical protein